MKFTCFFILLIISSCSGYERHKSNYKSMFLEGIENHSTSPSNIVISVVNQKTGKTKEICCDTQSFFFALSTDSINPNFYFLRYTDIGIPKFEFKSNEALSLLRFFKYEIDKVDSISQNTNPEVIDSILSEKKKKGYSKLLELKISENEKKYFEHYLYRNGIQTERDCESGYTIIADE